MIVFFMGKMFSLFCNITQHAVIFINTHQYVQSGSFVFLNVEEHCFVDC